MDGAVNWLLDNGFVKNGECYDNKKCRIYLYENKISIIFGEMMNNVKTTAQMVDNLINLKLI